MGRYIDYGNIVNRRSTRRGSGAGSLSNAESSINHKNGPMMDDQKLGRVLYSGNSGDAEMEFHEKEEVDGRLPTCLMV